MKIYIAPTAEIVSLDIEDIIASSPYDTEEITPTGSIIEWDWVV